MPNQGHNYELLVKRYFEECLAEEFRQQNVIVHNRKKYPIGGDQIEIDLSYEFVHVNMRFLVLIECKNWTLPVDRDQVMNLQMKVQNLRAHKGIVVSSAGFQKGAINYALEVGIALLKVLSENDVERYSHYTGQSLDQLNLTESTTISGPINSSKGVVRPNRDLLQFISDKYGTEVSGFVFDCLRNLDAHGEDYDITREIFNLDAKLLHSLCQIPLDWSEEYDLQEKCGLPLNLTNENQARIINMIFLIAKTTKDGNYD